MLLTDSRPYQIYNYFSSNQPRALIKCIISDWDCWANALQIVNSATQRTVCHSPALLRCCLSCSMLLLVQRSNQTIEAAHTSITSVNKVVGHKIVQTKPNRVITGQITLLPIKDHPSTMVSLMLSEPRHQNLVDTEALTAPLPWFPNTTYRPTLITPTVNYLVHTATASHDNSE